MPLLMSLIAELGFDGFAPEVTGRSAYHPSVLLKLYIYGYLNRGSVEPSA
jgi:transposase